MSISLFRKLNILLACPLLLGTLATGTGAVVAPEEIEVGIIEHLGEKVPLDITFTDENGRLVSLGEVAGGKPIILALVYYRCPGICSPLLNGMADVLRKLDLEPVRDYAAISVSFDPSETYKVASEKRETYVGLVQKPTEASKERNFPLEGWRFLTGNPASINRLTEAVGFKYKPEGDQFTHSAALIVLGPDGKISRYLNGTDFLPFDLKMAVVEAANGRVGPTINRMLQYCFTYDPDGRRYVANFTSIAAVMIILSALIGVSLMIFAVRRRPVDSVDDSVNKDTENGN